MSRSSIDAASIAERTGLNIKTVKGRIDRGWPAEMLDAPVGTLRKSYRRRDADKAKSVAFRAMMDQGFPALVADAFVEHAPRWLNLSITRTIRGHRRRKQ